MFATHVLSCFNACACASLCLYHFAAAASLISILNSARHGERKKSQFYSDMSLFPNFYPLIQNMLWNPWHSLSGWHVFHAWDKQFWPLTRRVGHCLDTWTVWQGHAHTSVFVVWPIEPFVSGGGCLVLNAATPAANIGGRWSQKKIQQHMPLQKTTIKTFQVWLSHHFDLSSVGKAEARQPRYRKLLHQSSQLSTFIIHSVCHTLSHIITVIGVVCTGYFSQYFYCTIQINQCNFFLLLQS